MVAVGCCTRGQLEWRWSEENDGHAESLVSGGTERVAKGWWVVLAGGAGQESSRGLDRRGEEVGNILVAAASKNMGGVVGEVLPGWLDGAALRTVAERAGVCRGYQCSCG